jgi:hypothetical protein
LIVLVLKKMKEMEQKREKKILANGLVWTTAREVACGGTRMCKSALPEVYITRV